MTDNEKLAASAVLAEWRQKADRPEAVDALYRSLGMSDGDV